MARLSEIQGESSTQSSGKMRLSDLGKASSEEPSGWEKAGATARGLATGSLGSMGDIQEFVTKTIPEAFGGSEVQAKMPGPQNKYLQAIAPHSAEGFKLPTGDDLEKHLQTLEKSVGATPGVKPGLEPYREGGQFVGGFLAPGAGTAKLVSKPIMKGAELISRARGKPLEQALKTMTTSAEDIAKAKTVSTVAKEASETERLTAEQSRLGKEQTKRGMAQRDLVKQLESGVNVAKEESVSTLNKIAKPSDNYQLGSSLREKIKGVESKLKEAADKTANTLKTKYFSEGQAKEKAGQFWSRSQTGQSFLKYLRDVVNPANSGKYTQAEVDAVKDLRESLIGRSVGGKIVRSEIGKIESVIRDTKKISQKPTMTGADAMKQQYMGRLAQKLEDSVYGYVDEAGSAIEGFAPTGRVFRETYREMMKPLNMYKSPVGKVASQEIEGLKGVFSSDASVVPKAVFKSPEQVKYLERMGVSKAELKPYAQQHTANQLSQLKTAEEVNTWMKSTDAAYLKEFPEVAKQAEDYARVFAKNESTIAGKAEAAGKIKESIKTGPQRVGAQVKDLEREIQDLQKMSRTNAEYIANGAFRIEQAKDTAAATSQARAYVYGLKERGIITEPETMSLLKDVAEVERQMLNKSAAVNALKGVLPWLGAAGVIGGAVGGYSLNKIIGGLNAL